MSAPEFRRFMVFSTPEFYPSGGLGDVRKSFDTLDEVRRFLPTADLSSDGAYVFDRLEGRTIDLEWNWHGGQSSWRLVD